MKNKKGEKCGKCTWFKASLFLCRQFCRCQREGGSSSNFFFTSLLQSQCDSMHRNKLSRFMCAFRSTKRKQLNNKWLFEISYRLNFSVFFFHSSLHWKLLTWTVQVVKGNIIWSENSVFHSIRFLWVIESVQTHTSAEEMFYIANLTVN